MKTFSVGLAKLLKGKSMESHTGGGEWLSEKIRAMLGKQEKWYRTGINGRGFWGEILGAKTGIGGMNPCIWRDATIFGWQVYEALIECKFFVT